MAKASAEVITHCPSPKCGKPIYSDHSNPWCIECGEPLPDNVQEQIPQLRELRTKASAARLGLTEPRAVDPAGLAHRVVSESPGSQLPRPQPEAQPHPLLSVWLEPGATISRIASSTPMRLYYPLAAVWGASFNLSRAIRKGISAKQLAEAGISSAWGIVAVNLAYGAVFGIVALWALSFLFAWIARRLGGRGGARQVRTVLAWSSVPHIPNLALAVLVLLFGGTAVLTASHPTGTSISDHPLQMVFVLITSVLGFWGLVISVAGMSAIMEISGPRAFGVYLLGGIVVFATLLLVIVGVR